MNPWKIIDQRSDELPIVNSAVSVIGIVAAYLYIVLSLGPRLMEKRQPFQIKNVLIIYNMFQIFANLAVMIYVSSISLDFLLFFDSKTFFLCFFGWKS